MTEPKKLKILCLHGNSQDAEIFSQRLRFASKLKSMAELYFIDAPFELPLKEGERVPMRTWFRHSSKTELNDLKKSIQVLKEFWDKHQGFDGIFSFSQGGMMAYILLCEILIADSCYSTKIRNPPFAVFAGSYFPSDLVQKLKYSNEKTLLNIPSLHFAGTEDKLVSLKHSKELFEQFIHDKRAFHVHSQGHVFPQRQFEFDLLKQFIIHQYNDFTDLLETESVSDTNIKVDLTDDERTTCEEMQTEEICALEAIFENNIEILSPFPLSFSLTIDAGEIEDIDETIIIKVDCLESYPLKTSPIFTNNKTKQVLDVQSFAIEMDLLGNSHVFDTIEYVKENIGNFIDIVDQDSTEINKTNDKEKNENEQSGEQGEGGEEEMDNKKYLKQGEFEATEEENEFIRIATEEAAEYDYRHPQKTLSKSRGGEWKFVVGLVGKPSAGKSTFFNACTDPDLGHAAKIAAFPFTTIDPNIGQGSYRIDCPCTKLDFPSSKCGCVHGEIEIPILIKDVAGLVPGAYAGKGKGNKFLDDLCDADVLVHVVDASGTTDKEGNETLDDVPEEKNGNPANDIAWVREELHRWIYSNVLAKWDTIIRRPEKFKAMFTGYRASALVVEESFRRANVTSEELTLLASWSSLELHKVVSHFLRVRFPCLLALNKVDIDKSHDIIKTIAQVHPHEPIALMSAKYEWEMCKLRKNNDLNYSIIGKDLKIIHNEKLNANESLKQKVNLLETLFENYKGNFGVVNAINKAVSLKPPIVCFPVQDLDSCLGLTNNRKSTTFGQQILVHPQTTVEDLYNVLKRSPHYLLSGNFVRSEAIDINNKKRRLIRKQDMMDETNALINIMTNRKTTWQSSSPNA